MSKAVLVTMGGGTGHYNLLSGLKGSGLLLYSVVAMADSGGSTGVLRDEYGVLPPGDIRQCLVALSSAERELRDLFAYRYKHGSLEGHSFGNIFLTTLEKVTASFPEAVKYAGKILQVKGRVLPVTLSKNMQLLIKLKDGTELFGERHLDDNQLIKDKGVKEVILAHTVDANPEAVQIIKKADMIILAPGDIWASIMPNLLLPEISDAINKSKAKLVYVANITNKKGISEWFSVCDYVRILKTVIREPDIVVFNSEPVSDNLLSKYIKQEGEGVIVNICKELQGKIISGNFLKEEGGLLRHDSEKLADTITQLI